MGKPSFGIILAEQFFHTSPECPYVFHGMSQVFFGFIMKYKDVQDALNQGHLRQCQRCVNDIVSEYEENKFMRLTVEQYDTLRTIVNLYDKNGATMSLVDMANARNKKVSTCFAIARVLEKKNLIKKYYKTGGQRATKGSIHPTTLARSVLQKVIA